MSFVIGGNNPVSTGYNLTRSLRFRASASATVSRTFTTPTSNQKMTLSCWVKLGSVSQTAGTITLLTGGDGTQTNSTNDAIQLRTNGTGLQLNILCKGGGTAANGGYRTFAPLYRDYAGWYHVVLAVDTTQASAANRYRGYVNGVELTSYTGTDPNQNVNLPYLNTAVGHFVGKANEGGGPYYTDAYLAEQIWVDGQQLTPSSFGSTNALTGVWQPAAYTGTYGTNGFYLPFTDNSALTTSSNVGLGKDFSGNANYWVTNNISITAGVTYDSMTDVPTLTSATAANFAVLNPLGNNGGTVLDGNINHTGTTALTANTLFPSTGKWYCEMLCTAYGGGATLGYAAVGVIQSTQTLNTVPTSVASVPAGIWEYRNDAIKINNGSSASYGNTWTANDLIGIAFDVDAGKVWFAKNNTWQASGDPAAGTNAAYTNLLGSIGVLINDFGTYSNSFAANFGQRPFTYTPPTGFVALNTYNLPTSTIVKGNTVMDATLYTGNSSTQTITNAGAFKPDFVWIKNRSTASQHVLTDSVRGITKQLFSSNTNAEQTSATGITALNSNGFSLDTNVSPTGSTNSSPDSYVGWQWQAGQGSSSSNTNGSITSTVSVNASAGFSVVTYTGTGANATVGHGLGVAPQLVITKSRSDGTYGWTTYHTSVGAGACLFLNTTGASNAGVNIWNNTSPTSSVFSIGTDAYANYSGKTYVAYCWTPIAGYSAFGSYTGNGSTDGVFVYTPFRPKFVIIKRTDAVGDWYTFDSVRDPYNATAQGLLPNTSQAEATYTGWGDLLSNGFKIRRTDGAWNASGGTYIYMAYAENPLKNSLAR